MLLTRDRGWINYSGKNTKLISTYGVSRMIGAVCGCKKVVGISVDDRVCSSKYSKNF